MRNSAKQRVIPDTQDISQYEHLIPQAQEMMQLAYLMNVDILQAFHDAGKLSKVDLENAQKTYLQQKNAVLAQPLLTVNNILAFFQRSREELKHAIAEVKTNLPEYFPNISQAT